MTAMPMTPQPTVDEIADGIYRIATWIPDVSPQGFTFNQFLAVGDEPLLVHTGMRGLFPLLADARRPGRLRVGRRTIRATLRRPGRITSFWSGGVATAATWPDQNARAQDPLAFGRVACHSVNVLDNDCSPGWGLPVRAARGRSA